MKGLNRLPQSIVMSLGTFYYYRLLQTPRFYRSALQVVRTSFLGPRPRFYPPVVSKHTRTGAPLIPNDHRTHRCLHKNTAFNLYFYRFLFWWLGSRMARKLSTSWQRFQSFLRLQTWWVEYHSLTSVTITGCPHLITNKYRYLFFQLARFSSLFSGGYMAKLLILTHCLKRRRWPWLQQGSAWLKH